MNAAMSAPQQLQDRGHEVAAPALPGVLLAEPVEDGGGHTAALSGAGCSGVTSSGQMRCQSSGRRSRRVTAPAVAFSMAAQCSLGTFPGLLSQFHTCCCFTPMAPAKAA